MITTILIAHIYKPGSAATNRIWAYAKSYRELGQDVILVLGSRSEFIITEPQGVEIVSCVGKNVNRLMAKEIKSRYTPGMAIQIYGTPGLCWYLPKNKFPIFCEYTEVPFYGHKKTIVSIIKESLKLWLTKRTKGLFVISESLKDYYNRNGFQSVEIINMFVDPSRFIDNQKEDGRYIAYCGKISYFKDGVDSLIKAYKLFSQDYPDYKLKIIGGFETLETEAKLKELVKSLGLSNLVEFTGKVSPDCMPSLLCGATILALARPNNEQAKYGFPTKLGEYLSTGKPVVVTEVGELNHFLTDKHNCIFAKPDDHVDFYKSLKWTMENYQEALEIGKMGQKLTLSAFSSKVQCERAINFMNSVFEN